MASSSRASCAPSIADRFATVEKRMAKACRMAGRDVETVTLVAVSKTQPPEAIAAALAAGQTVFGENRVQEAQERWLRQGFDRGGVELRLIGPLQTNKAKDALELFDVIESLDRQKLAIALSEAGQALGRTPRVLVQVNTGDEPQKAGIPPREADALIAFSRARGLNVEGLMCIPPADEEPSPHFALLKKIGDRNGLKVLSMGMSGDYEAAIRHGATHVRVGSALFGERKTPQTSSSD